MTAIRMAPPTPPPAILLRMVVRSSEPPPVATFPVMLWRIVPPKPPPTIPAMEFPRVPRLFSFMAAPATLPPIAPLITSIMRLIMFIGLVSVCSRFGFHRLGLRTGHSEKRQRAHESEVARPQCQAARGGDHATLQIRTAKGNWSMGPKSYAKAG